MPSSRQSDPGTRQANIMNFMRDLDRHKITTLTVLVVTNFCSGICVSLQAPFYPKEAEAKGATPTAYGFVFGTFELFVFIFSPIFGKYLHKIGVKNALNVGNLTTGVCCVIFGLLGYIEGATLFIGLGILSRSIEAIGNAAFITASFSIIAAEFPSKMAMVFSIVETAFGFGLIAGPSIGGFIYNYGGFTLPFVIMGSIFIASSFFAFGCMSNVYNNLEVAGRRSAGDVIRIPAIQLNIFNLLSASVSLGFILTCLEPHVRSLNLSEIMISTLFVIHGGTYALAGLIIGYITHNINPLYVQAFGSILTFIGFGLLGPFPSLHLELSEGLVIGSLVIIGIGFSSFLIATFSHSQSVATSRGRLPADIATFGMISGLWASVFAFGAFAGPCIAGALMDRYGFPRAASFVLIQQILVLFVTGIFIYLDLRSKRMKAAYEALDETVEREEQSETDEEPYVLVTGSEKRPSEGYSSGSSPMESRSVSNYSSTRNIPEAGIPSRQPLLQVTRSLPTRTGYGSTL